MVLLFAPAPDGRKTSSTEPVGLGQKLETTLTPREKEKLGWLIQDLVAWIQDPTPDSCVALIQKVRANSKEPMKTFKKLIQTAIADQPNAKELQRTFERAATKAIFGFE